MTMISEPILTVGIFTEQAITIELSHPFARTPGNVFVEGRITVRPHGSGLLLEGEHERVELPPEIVLRPPTPEASFVLRDVTIGVQFHWQRKEDQRFVGALKLARRGDAVAAINVVPIESYLTSVISSEMSAKCSLNLLKAHAVTSRSWLLAQLEKSRSIAAKGKQYTAVETPEERVRWYDREDHADFDVCADDHCQRYQGITKACTEAVQKAVEETRGNVLMAEGRVCDARFSKSCGGISEAFENVWEPARHSYLTPVWDAAGDGDRHMLPDLTHEGKASTWIRESPHAFCNTRDPRILSQVLLTFDRETVDFYRWKVEYAQAELSEIIRQRSGIDFGAILDLVPVQRGFSGRLITLTIVGTKKRLTIGKELEIRRTLSRSHLYSSAFVVEKSGVQAGVPGRFMLRGAGWGHGVGLCQIGAAVMGEEGYTAEAILRHYFRGAEIVTLY
jgi:stage II sporulation protein D